MIASANRLAICMGISTGIMAVITILLLSRFEANSTA